MYNTTADYCIDSESEFEKFVWYNILYRKSNVEFYKNFNSVYSIETLTKRAIESYPEYNGINTQSVYSSAVKGKVYRILKDVTYYLENDKLESDAIVKSVASVGNAKYTYDDYTLTYSAFGTDTILDTLNGTDSAFAKTFETETHTRDFPIDDCEGIEVGNSEQLCMATTYGKKPIIKDNNSVVATIYNNARNILSQINTDEMSDYDKVKNIYDYIIGHNVYNNTIISYMNKSKDFSQKTYGNYSDFYLEGILYDLDKQVAVCDGISKTFALLCNIEGIEAIKVNGEVESSTGYGDHAWNKVKLGDNWYCVDITWADYTYNGEDPEDSTKTVTNEAATHMYFLVSDETLRVTANRQESWPANSPTTVDYDYYTNTTLTSPEDDSLSQSMIVNNRAELRKLISIADELEMSGVEILLTDEYYDAMDNIEDNLDRGWIEHGDNKISISTMNDSLHDYSYTAFVYNEESYAIKNESIASDALAVYKVFYINNIAVDYTKVSDVGADGSFTIGEESFTYIPCQQDNEGDLYRTELGYNTPSVKRISYVCYDNFLIIWIGKYPTVEGED